MGIGVDIGVRLAGMGSHPSGAPPVETIVRTPLGAATAIGLTLTKTGVNVAAGSYLFVYLGSLNCASLGFAVSGVTLNGNAVFAAVPFTPHFQNSELTTLCDPSGGAAILYVYCASAIVNGTVTVTFEELDQVAADTPSLMLLSAVSGLAASGAFDKSHAARNTVKSDPPNSGATDTTSQAHEYVTGLVVSSELIGDAVSGAWTAPLEAGQRAGANFEDLGVVLSEGYCVQTVAAAQTAAKTGMDSIWVAAGVATFRSA
jgi:hypothetical protein